MKKIEFKYNSLFLVRRPREGGDPGFAFSKVQQDPKTSPELCENFQTHSQNNRHKTMTKSYKSGSPPPWGRRARIAALIQASSSTSIGLACLALLLSACGRHETAGGTFGTAAGALIGSSITDRRDKTTGAVLGGIIGNMIGGSVGRAADQEEAAEQQHHHNVIRERERQIAAREAEMHRTRNGLDRWCMSCYRQNNIAGAQRCPSCGDGLIREKYCNGCLTIFSATSAYRYCPYCRERHALVYR